eukprot:TRINITY_DN728_c0_g3_i2.p1 TRINITY_DN728_c0_g3~~TRINITY_DN728_c0_g3_i2.p1  ORF type:complete len:292 (-),score=29.93 TRINITY_DN728_c0_g3_i2:1912-2787(-)
MAHLLAPAFVSSGPNYARLHLNTRNTLARTRVRHSPVFATPDRRKHVAMVRANYRLAPSDFAFLWEECKRCFYLKVHGALPRPRAPFPSVFSSIDLAMKRHMSGLRTDQIFPEMRPGTILCEEDDPWIEGQPIFPPGHSHSVYIRGKIDALVRFDDGTYGVIDFKTSSAASSSSIYARQLHAYATALENPSSNSQLEKTSVSQLGLVVYTPSEFHTPLDNHGKIHAAMTGALRFIPVDRDDRAFHKFLADVLEVLDMPEAPPPKLSTGRNFSNCSYCNYLHQAHKNGLSLA